MSNWIGTARTNYVKFASYEGYETAKALVEDSGNEMHPHPRHELVAMISGDDDSGGFNFTRWSEEEGDTDTEWWWPEVAKHLADGQVLVAIEAGAEKLRYVSGHAFAVHKDGRTVAVSLAGIYDMALEAFGIRPTSAEYDTFTEVQHG